MFNPTITENRTSRDITETFNGYDARLKISDGFFNNTENLTTDYYPLLAPRKLRTFAAAGQPITFTHPGGLLGKDCLAYVESGKLYYDFKETPVTGLSYGDKQLISMGAYICIFPDAVYFNTEDENDYGSMEAHYPGTEAWHPQTYVMCHQDGSPYVSVTESETEPTDTNTIWIKTQVGNTTYEYYSWSQSTGTWIELNTVYTRINFDSFGVIPKLFKQFDAVEISGSKIDEINGTKAIYALGGSVEENVNDYIVVVYPLTQQGIVADEDELITIDRKVPEMDYVIECQNRLWGCKYGYDVELGKTVNEIYCCALGDFKNWKQFLGLSTDSWTGSVGSDGEWTGAINYLGYPTFFKEDRIHVVNISQVGAHGLSETPCRGVQKGSHKSLKIVGETLYYKARNEIMQYRGSFPAGVSEALGDVPYSDAIAGSIGDRYYVCMKRPDGEHELFILDTSRGLWLREGADTVSSFAAVDDSLFAVLEKDGQNFLVDLRGKHEGITEEGPIAWEAQTGILYYQYPDNKYVTRFNIRCKGNAQTRLRVYINYDSDGVWVDQGEWKMNGTNTITIPVRPHRCDHMQLKLVGSGDIRIFSIARILEVGSDV